MGQKMHKARASRDKALVFNFFHVGDGDCVLVELPGEAGLGVIDSRRPMWLKESPVVTALKARTKGKKKHKLAFVCISHPHRDHVEGIGGMLGIKGLQFGEFWHPLPDMEELLAKHAAPIADPRYPQWSVVSQFYYDDQIREFVDFARTAIQRCGRERVRPLRGITVLPDLAGVQVFALNPSQGAMSRYKENLEERYGRLERLNREALDDISVALAFVYGENTLIYASDMQARQWQEVIHDIETTTSVQAILPGQVVKSSHHGGPRSYFDGLWGRLLGPSNGSVIVSGGSKTHPSEEMIGSVLTDGRSLFCTGKARVCGRRASAAPRSAFYTDRWLAEYGDPVDRSARACCGDIRLVLPPKGPAYVDHPPPSCRLSSHWVDTPD